jgi:6-phosphogluconolactonase
MQFEVLVDAHAAARAAAAFIASEARTSVAARGRFNLAVSGGRTPELMLRMLADEDVPWSDVQIFQVDERVAAQGTSDRNWTQLRENLLARVPIAAAQVHPMPVEAPDLALGAAHYAAALRSIAGSPPVLDLVHLGLGADGHTASLVPGDPVLEIADADVGVTGSYRGCLRMTLTLPTLNRARRILWLVTGEEKADMLARLRAGDRSIPGGCVRQDNALVLADRLAARSA